MESVISRGIIESVIYLFIMAGLVVIHEFGHLLAGFMLGIPKKRMSIQFVDRKPEKGLMRSLVFSISPHIVLLDNKNSKVSPSPNEMEKYVGILEQFIPSEKKMFWFVAGGHTFELIIVLSMAIVSIISNHNLLFEMSFRITHMSLVLDIIYLLIDLFSALKSKELTGGDFSGQWAISPIKTIIFYAFYFTTLISAWILLK